jgi:hypothetical protein
LFANSSPLCSPEATERKEPGKTRRSTTDTDKSMEMRMQRGIEGLFGAMGVVAFGGAKKTSY